jgi:HPt (histidine-containing phosphotransfer) domain-containing protein
MSAHAGSSGGTLPDPEEAFRQRCRRDAARLARLRDQIEATPADRLDAVLADLEGVAHGLYGAGGTFGFDDVSAAAAELEALAESLRADGCRDWPNQRALVVQLTLKLLQTLGDLRRRS